MPCLLVGTSDFVAAPGVTAPSSAPDHGSDLQGGLAGLAVGLVFAGALAWLFTREWKRLS